MHPVTLDGDIALRTPRGRAIFFKIRLDTNDGALAYAIVTGDEYALGGLPPMSGLAIDIGAHIGSVAIPLAIDHPDLRVIAVEPVPENAVVLRTNIEFNGLTDRVTVVEAAASAPGRRREKLLWEYRSAGNEPPDYVRDSRYIANIYDAAHSDADAHQVEAVSLDKLMAGEERLRLLKIDCEGCEWQVLTSPRVPDIDYIVGEWHNGPRFAGISELLERTHDVTILRGNEDIGLFRAVRR